MAIHLTKLPASLKRAIAEVDEYVSGTPNDIWAVYFTYSAADMKVRIHEVAQWDPWRHRERAGLRRVKAPDEMGAYAAVVREFEGAN